MPDSYLIYFASDAYIYDADTDEWTMTMYMVNQHKEHACGVLTGDPGYVPFYYAKN